MRRSITVLILLAFTLAWVIPVHSYTLLYTNSSATVQIKWPTNVIRIALSTSLNTPQPHIKAGSDVEGAARRALAHWQSVSNVQFDITTSTQQYISPNGSGGDGISLITVAPQTEANLFTAERTGRTRIFFDPSTGAIAEADIAINANLQFSTDGTFNTYDLESVFTHEIGHLLGLEHSGVVAATMQPRQGANGLYGLPALTPRTLAADDIAGVRAIYGPHTGLGAIAGKILNGSSGTSVPLFGAHVWAENASTGRVMGGNVTLQDGSFRIDNLPPGQYRVNTQYLDGPVFGTEIASSSGAYQGIGSQPAFRTQELTSNLNVTAGTTTPLNSIITGSAAPPTLNPRLLGINGQLSTIAVPLAPGNTYTIYIGGDGVDQVSSTGVNITSPFFNINRATFLQQQFGDTKIISFDVTVSVDAPVGDYSVRLLSTTGEVAYVSGGLTIDNGLSNTNPIDDPQFFVRQHYLDFLNREPDPGGLDYWSSQITQCGTDPRCIHEQRISVSAAFFIETEFQETGGFVYRFYRASFNRRPSFNEFIADRNKVVAGSNLEASKQAFANEFVTRPAFLAEYPTSMTPEQYVDKLNANTGNSLTQTERDALVNGLKNNTETRATVLRAVADNSVFRQREYNSAFVLMQYFGYLRRDPDEAGYQFWLNVLNNREPNNYRGMVCSFITSAEYQLRFGTVITRSNRDCSQ